MQLFRRLRSIQTVWPVRCFGTSWNRKRPRRSRFLPAKGRRLHLASQSLEPRLALAFSNFESTPFSVGTGHGTTVPAAVAIVDARDLTPSELSNAIGCDPTVLIGRTPGIDTILHRVFAPAAVDAVAFDQEAGSLEQRLLTGTSALGVSFKIVDASVFGDHGGAYAAAAPGGPTIYLRADILAGAPQIARSIVVEEIGHHIDAILNHGVDSRGDEGEYFSDLVTGVSLTPADQKRLLDENDHGIITVDGTTVAVEFNTIGSAATWVKYAENGLAVPLQPHLTLQRNTGVGLSAPDTITSVSLTIPSASVSDRIRVIDATTDAAGNTPSTLANGIAVPESNLPETSFWVRLENGTSIGFASSVTASGTFTFTSPGTTGTTSFTAFQKLIRSVCYDNTSPAPATTGRLFTWNITSVVTSNGMPAPARIASETVTTIPTNNAPLIEVATPPNDLIEAGLNSDGVARSSATLKKSDVDSTSVTYDSQWLKDHGWTTKDSGQTFTANGTHGTATLTVATDTVTYQLDNYLPATENLGDGDVAEDTFDIQVIDNGVASRRSSGKPQSSLKQLTFRILGKNDFATTADTTESVSYTEKSAPVFLQPAITLHRNTGTESNAPETIKSVTLTIPEALTSDRIRVVGAKGDAAGIAGSIFDTGVSVPSDSTTSADFWVPTPNGEFTRFTGSVTPGGTYTFTSSLALGPTSFTAFENLLRKVQYESTTAAPIAGQRTFSWVIARTATGSDHPLLARTLEESVRIIPVNDAPVVAVRSPSNDLVEASPKTIGVNVATLVLTKSDVDSTSIHYDVNWMLSNGWKGTSSNGTYTQSGRYGTASLNVATDTIRYVLDDANPPTDALKTGETVRDLFLVRVADDLGATGDASVAFVIHGTDDASNSPPTIVASPVSNTLAEAGALVAGVNTASVHLAISSVDSTVSYDTGWLAAHGWVTADGGLTYAATGTYGTATLDVANNVVSYLLDNSLSSTNALSKGQVGVEQFAIQVIDTNGLTAQTTVEFRIIGSADTPTIVVGAVSNGLTAAGAGSTGVNTASAPLTISSVDSTVSYDTGWLAAHGWVTADSGLTYSFAGTYGTATLDVSTNVVSYLLDNSLAATKAPPPARSPRICLRSKSSPPAESPRKRLPSSRSQAQPMRQRSASVPHPMA